MLIILEPQSINSQGNWIVFFRQAREFTQRLRLHFLLPFAAAKSKYALTTSFLLQPDYSFLLPFTVCYATIVIDRKLSMRLLFLLSLFSILFLFFHFIYLLSGFILHLWVIVGARDETKVVYDYFDRPHRSKNDNIGFHCSGVNWKPVRYDVCKEISWLNKILQD